MKTPLAWHNIVHNKARSSASLAGVCFAIVLLYMQLGFYDACYRSSTMLLDPLDFDVVLVSPDYFHLRPPNTIPKRRLSQAAATPGVHSAVPCYVGNAIHRNPDDFSEHEIVVLGFDPDTQPFRLPRLRDSVHKLRREDTAIMDEHSSKVYGPVEIGRQAEIDNRRIEIVDTYAYGAGFICEATMIVSDRTFSKVFPGWALSNVNLGLVKLKRTADPVQVARDLKANLPPDVQVWLREEIEANEQQYYVELKPVGIMFSAGVILAFCVGAGLLYQVLASEIINQFKPYATLKAIGYQNGKVNRMVLQHATIFAIVGFVPATALAYVIYSVTSITVHLPMVMTLTRIVLVFVLSTIMCALSGLLVSRKVARADPAEELY